MGEKTDNLPWVQVEVQTRKMMSNVFYNFDAKQSHATEKSTFLGVTTNWSKWIHEKKVPQDMRMKNGKEFEHC